MEMLPHLPELWTCWLIELPGFGDSAPLAPEDTATLTIDDIGRMIKSEIEQLGILRPWLVGHSLGGYVAIAIADLNPADVSGLVLFHSSPFADSPERRDIRDKVIASVIQYGPVAFLETFSDALFYEKGAASVYYREQARSVADMAIISYARMMRDRPDRSSFCRKALIPVAVICGKHDPLISPDTVRQIAFLHPTVRVVELTRSAHAGMLEEPDRKSVV